MKFGFNKKKIVIFALVILLLFFSKIVFAVWDGTFYDPGDTLNPECLPTDSNCDVLIVASLPLVGGTMTGGIVNATSLNPLTTLSESWIGPSSTTGIYFKDDNVGIGTDNVTHKFTIFDNTNSSVFRINPGTGGDGGFFMRSGADNDGEFSAGYEFIDSIRYARSTEASGINFYGGNTYFMNDNGLTPGDNYDSSTRFFIESTGYVGIGTSTPSETLDVNGRMHIAQTTAPEITTDKLYNVSGDLYWNEKNLASGNGKVYRLDPSLTSADNPYIAYSHGEDTIIIMEDTGSNYDNYDSNDDVTGGMTAFIYLPSEGSSPHATTPTSGGLYADDIAATIPPTHRIKILGNRGGVTGLSDLRLTVIFSDNGSISGGRTLASLYELSNGFNGAVIVQDPIRNSFTATYDGNSSDIPETYSQWQYDYSPSFFGADNGDGWGNNPSLDSGGWMTRYSLNEAEYNSFSGIFSQQPTTKYHFDDDGSEADILHIVGNSTEGNNALRISTTGDYVTNAIGVDNGTTTYFSVTPGGAGYFAGSVEIANGLTINNTDNNPLRINNTVDNDSIQIYDNSSSAGNRMINITHDTSANSSDVISVNMANGSGSFTGDFLDFNVNSVNKFKLDNTGGAYFAGNVGIGVLAPTEKVEIAGGNLRVWNDNELGSEVVTGWTTHPTNIYETFTTSGADITSAINTTALGAAYGTGGFSATAGNLYKVTFNITLNSGTMPAFRVGQNAGMTVYSFTQNAISGENTMYVIISDTATHWAGFYNANNVATDFSVNSFSMKRVIGGNVIASGQYTGGGASGIKIDTTGLVGIGTNTPGNKLSVLGDAGDTTVVSIATTSGNSCSFSTVTGAFSCASDSRLKNNILSIGSEDALSKIAQLNPVTYRYNWQNENDPLVSGFIAQEFENIFPELVSTDPVTGYKSLSYAPLMPYAIKAIQEMNLNLNTVAGTTIPSPGSSSETFASAFFVNIKTTISGWLADTGNGVTDLFANVFNAKEKICVDGECLNKDDIRALLLLVHPNVVNTPSPAHSPVEVPAVAPAPAENPVVADPIVVPEVINPVVDPTPVVEPVVLPEIINPVVVE